MTYKCKSKTCEEQIYSANYCQRCTDEKDLYCPCCYSKLDRSECCLVHCEAYEKQPHLPPLPRAIACEQRTAKNDLLIRQKQAEIKRLQDANNELVGPKQPAFTLDTARHPRQ